MGDAKLRTQTSPLVPQRRIARMAGWIAIAAICLALAAMIDWRAGHLYSRTPLIPRGGWLAWTLKLPGHFAVTLAIAAALVGFGHRLRFRAAGLVVMAGIISGIIPWLMKWMIGRTRPFRGDPPRGPFEFYPFPDGFSGLVNVPNLCFPSGHASLAFAVAGALMLLMPRWRLVWIAVAAATAIERVLEGAHYPSDVVAGAFVGLSSALLAATIDRRLFGQPPPLPVA